MSAEGQTILERRSFASTYLQRSFWQNTLPFPDILSRVLGFFFFNSFCYTSPLWEWDLLACLNSHRMSWRNGFQTQVPGVPVFFRGGASSRVLSMPFWAELLLLSHANTHLLGKISLTLAPGLIHIAAPSLQRQGYALGEKPSMSSAFCKIWNEL